MKILLVTHYYPEHRGGVEIVAGQLSEYLLKQDNIEITWMASNVDPYPSDIAGLKCLSMTASNLIENKVKIPYPIWSLPSLFKLWQEIKKANIIHIHDYLYMSNLATFVFAKIQKKTLVITQHIGFIPYDSPLFRGLLSFLNSTLGCFILRYVDQTIFISEVVQKYFSEKTSFRRPALMIPNGVDTDIYVPANTKKRKENRQKLGISVEKNVFLFVGRFVEKKGLPIIEKLAQKFPSLEWIFAGWGPLDPETWGLSNVRVFRDRRGTQLTPLYQVADLLVLPSKGEGFPLVVQEAMACGTPVLIGSETAKACTAAQHLILSEAVEVEDVIGLWSTKISNILDDLSYLSDLREPVADFAQQYWSWTKCSQEYYQIFEALNESKNYKLNVRQE
ncbi:glycosyltransferase family 4 protein [Crocosphaera sp.]|uniref:glycosyltransferase family 4 protein n=1 Tax=Crocosphaera sp. TaxID=2729996 RepID=UPI003F215CFE|nr:glycosyltransferase family 4 protein [Crocosphaera sp.]